jgi:hypothetical protein
VTSSDRQVSTEKEIRRQLDEWAAAWQAGLNISRKIIMFYVFFCRYFIVRFFLMHVDF